MEWLVSFIQTFTSIFPHMLHVTEDMRAVKLYSSNHKLLLPGYHFYLPCIHEVRVCYITRQELDLPEQILTTSDGITVLVSASIVYRIHGVLKALINTQDYSSTVVEVAQRAVSEMVTSSTSEEVLNHSAGFDHALIMTAQKDLADYGLKIDEAFFTSAAETQSYHLTGVYVSITGET